MTVGEVLGVLMLASPIVAGYLVMLINEGWRCTLLLISLGIVAGIWVGGAAHLIKHGMPGIGG